ncbi:MAG TPA: PhoU domain-containing protein, partial [Nitrososphaerales archaeon]|nr:PhoU domain-containing protein [Nitrososphaerales archaeon]
YHFILRQLNLAVRNRSIIENIGLTSARDCLGYRLAVKSVERVGDHAAAVAELVSGVREGATEKAMEEVEKMSDLSLKAFGDSVSALLRLDRKLANEAIALTRRVTELDEKISGELLAPKTDPDTFGSIKLILESIRRVGEYGSDIAEIAVDLTVKEP